MAKKQIKKTSSKTEPKKKAYTRYVQDPVFLGLIVLVLLLGMVAMYFASTGDAVVVVDDDTGGTDTGGTDTGTDDPTTGDGLIIYVFSEFKCPYCGAAAGFNDALLEQFKAQDPTYEASVPKITEVYGDQVEVIFKNFIVHESAQMAAEAGECARDQGKFWAMHDIMFQNMGTLESDDLKGFAADIGLDTAKFDACLDNGDKTAIVAADTQMGRDLGVSGTPTFFVGGEKGYKIVGAQPYSAFVESIDNALAGVFPAPPPTDGASIGTFKSFEGDEVCTEDGKPIISLYSTTWCPHCKWITETYESTVQEYVDAGQIVAQHWEIDINDDTLTEEVETEFPAEDNAIYSKFNPRGSIPTFVFGCKYYRVGNGYESQQDLASEEEDFRAVIEALIEEAA
jgi:protein-disulfide isomerase